MKWYEQPPLTTLTDDCKILVFDSETQSSRSVNIGDLKSFVGTPSTQTSGVKELTFTVDGDNNGLCYFLGTNRSTTIWQNPHNNSLVISASAIGFGSPQSLVDRQASEFYTPSDPNSWIKLSIFNGVLKCKYYSLRNRNQNDHYLRTWKLQGSNDDSNWTDIDVHTNNTALNSPSQWLSFPVTSSVAYKHFRLLMTGQNSSGQHYLCLGEIELYGTYTY